MADPKNVDDLFSDIPTLQPTLEDGAVDALYGDVPALKPTLDTESVDGLYDDLPYEEVGLGDWVKGRSAQAQAVTLGTGSSLIDQFTSPVKQFFSAALGGVDPNEIQIGLGGMNLDAESENMRELADVYRQEVYDATPGSTGWKYLTQLTDAMIQMGPSIAANKFLKNPNAGLGVMGMTVFGDAYSGARIEGKSHDEALLEAGKQVIYEVGPEKAFGFFDNLLFGNSVKNILKSAGIEAVSEATTSGANILDETLLQGKEFDLGEVVKRVLWDASLGAGLGGGLSAVSGSASAEAKQKQLEDIKITDEDLTEAQRTVLRDTQQKMWDDLFGKTAQEELQRSVTSQPVPQPQPEAQSETLPPIGSFGEEIPVGQTGLDQPQQQVSLPLEEPERPKGEIVEGVTSYRSGASGPADMLGYHQAGVPYGVAVDQLSGAGTQQLVEQVEAGDQVFIDSGEFPNFMKGFNEDGTRKVDTDFGAVMARYSEILESLSPEAAQRVSFVMPDHIGEAERTAQTQAQWKDQIQQIASRANVIVPLQLPADANFAQYAEQLSDLVGGNNYLLGIPSNQEAFSVADLRNMVQSWPKGMEPKGVHFLGIAAQKEKLAQLRDEVRKVWPDAQIFSDANRLRAKTRQISPVTKMKKQDKAAAATQSAQGGPTDSTELTGRDMTKTQIKEAAKILGQSESAIRALIKSDRLDAYVESQFGDRIMEGFWDPIARAEAAKQETRAARAESVARSELPALRYDPATDKYDGQPLRPGDLLIDNNGKLWEVDRASGFMLQLNDAKQRNQSKSVSVDPTDKSRYQELRRYEESESQAAAQAEQSWKQDLFRRAYEQLHFAARPMFRAGAVKSKPVFMRADPDMGVTINELIEELGWTPIKGHENYWFAFNTNFTGVIVAQLHDGVFKFAPLAAFDELYNEEGDGPEFALPKKDWTTGYDNRAWFEYFLSRPNGEAIPESIAEFPDIYRDPEGNLAAKARGDWILQQFRKLITGADDYRRFKSAAKGADIDKMTLEEGLLWARKYLNKGKARDINKRVKAEIPVFEPLEGWPSEPTEAAMDGHIPGFGEEANEVLTEAQAQARIQRWKDIAYAQGETGKNSDKVILSLFDRTGRWSQPYVDAGYTVVPIDLDPDGFIEMDVMEITRDWLIDNGYDSVHGVLAAPPCTDFASSGARWFEVKDKDGTTQVSLDLLDQTIAIIEWLKPEFWVMENPVGRLPALRPHLGKPHIYFQPHDYGDPYTKKTGLWGNFDKNMPKAQVFPSEGSKIHKLRGDDPEQKKERSVTPEGFAYAFFIANSSVNPNHVDLSGDGWTGDYVVDALIQDYPGGFFLAKEYAREELEQGRGPDERSLEERGIDQMALSKIADRLEKKIFPNGDPEAGLVPTYAPERTKTLSKAELKAKAEAAAGARTEPTRTPPDEGKQGKLEFEEELSTRSGSPEFMRISETNRPSYYQNIWSDNGIDPDIAENWALKRQFAKASQIFKDVFGIKVRLERAKYNEAMDQLQDAYRNLGWMAHVLGLPAAALGMRDNLTLTIKGKARYLGAYSPDGHEILIPGRSNSFGHEWGHALDYFILNSFPGGAEQFRGMSGRVRSDGVEPVPDSIQEAFVSLMDRIFFDASALAADIIHWEDQVLNGTEAQKAEAQRHLEEARKGNLRTFKNRNNYYRSAKEFGDLTGGRDYWIRPTEMLARAFEAYVAERVATAGGGNEFITKGDDNYLSDLEPRLKMTFPKLEDRARIFEAFDRLFQQLAGNQLLHDDPIAMPVPPPEDKTDLRQFDKASEASGLPKNWLRKELEAWKDGTEKLVRAFKDRPEHPVALWRRLEDLRQFVMSSMRARARTLERRNKDSRAMKALFDELFVAPGEDRLVEEVFTEEVQRRYMRFTGRFERILKSHGLENLSVEQNDQLREILLGNEIDAPLRVKKAASAIRKLFKQAYYDFKNAGIEIGVVNDKGYLTRYYDDAKILDQLDAFKDKAMEFFENHQIIHELGLDGVAREDYPEAMGPEALQEFIMWAERAAQTDPDLANELGRMRADLRREQGKPDPDESLIDEIVMSFVDQYFEQVVGYWAASRTDSWIYRIQQPEAISEYDRPGSNILRRRSFVGAADDILKDYLMTDVAEIVDRYARASARKISFARRFGTKGERAQALFDRMLKEGVPGHDITIARDMYQIVTGTAASKHSRELQTISDGVHAAGYITLLSRVLISSLAEGGAYAIRTGRFRDTFAPMKMMWEAVRRSQKSKDLKEIAQAMGTIGTAATEAVLANQLGGEYQSSVRAAKLMQFFFSKTGLTTLTQYQRTYGIGVAHSFFTKLSKDVLSQNPDVAAEARADFNELGIGNHEEFATWILSEGNRIPTIEDLFHEDGTSTEMGHTFMVAANRFIDQSIQNPDVTVRAQITNNPYGRLTHGILSFAYAFAENLIKREAKVIRRKGWKRGSQHLALRTLPAFAVLYGHQLAVSVLREMLFNAERYEDMDDEEKWAIMLEKGFFRAFGLGAADPFVQYLSGLQYGRDLAYTLIGPAPGYFAQQVDRIASVWWGRNSEDTTNTEFRAMEAVYRGVMLPLINTTLSILPGGVITRVASGAAITAAPAGADDFASMFFPRPDRETAVDQEYTERRGEFQDELDEISRRLRSRPNAEWGDELKRIREEYPHLMSHARFQRYKNTAENRRQGKVGQPVVRGSRVQFEGLPKTGIPSDIRTLSGIQKKLVNTPDYTYQLLFKDLPKGMSARADTLRSTGRTGVISRSERDEIRKELAERERSRKKEEISRLRSIRDQKSG